VWRTHWASNNSGSSATFQFSLPSIISDDRRGLRGANAAPHRWSFCADTSFGALWRRVLE
jgi:hypothetical protein